MKLTILVQITFMELTTRKIGITFEERHQNFLTLVQQEPLGEFLKIIGVPIPIAQKCIYLYNRSYYNNYQ